ncbi:MAG: type IV pili methyl-accepting chemotaxis transducer N-terminal domain-containing protein [Pseudomonadota bacterium]
MIRNLHRLSFKVSGILIGFSVIAIAAIGMTLYVSWKLQGGAAAINDMGSERMRSYRIANILSELAIPDGDRPAVAGRAQAEIDRFERVLQDLKQGDPGRPLFVPTTPEIRDQLAEIERRWREQIRPAAEAVLAAPAGPVQEDRFRDFRHQVDEFVALIDALVGAVEAHNSKYTSLLGSLQLGLMALAVAGAVSLIFLVFLLVVRPVQTLREGMQRMEQEEFGARVPVETRDEFGDLARGFNRMADHLEGLYRTLEDRVKAKTRRLEQKNRELSTLYDVSTFLNTPATTEELCRGFVRRLIRVFDAGAGSVRLVHPDSGDIHMFVSEGLAKEFVEEERCLKVGDCLCGEAVRDATPMVRVFPAQAPDAVLYRCQRIGFETVSVFTIRVKKQLLGVFNLYFTRKHEFTHEERLMLETLGQHLGIAIENQRLLSREREMAVSEERNLLAQELHDSIAQSLAFLNLQTQMLQDALRRHDVAESLEGLALIREGIQESYDDVRELLVHFRTRIGQADIEAALRAALEKFEGQTGIATRLEVQGTGIPLPPEVQIQVLHIVQEALSNVRKHAGASKVDVSLAYDHAYRFTVRDDGRGFDAEFLRDRTDAHVGLKIMRERAHRIGGRLDLRSRPGAGTEVTLTLPIAREEAAA